MKSFLTENSQLGIFSIFKNTNGVIKNQYKRSELDCHLKESPDYAFFIKEKIPNLYL